LALAVNGHNVLFYDVDKAVFEDLPKFAERTTDWHFAYSYGEVLMICVPTASSAYGACDLGIVEGVVDMFAAEYHATGCRQEKALVQKSTCPPGTARLMISRLKQEHSILPESYHYLVCPEFLNSGTPIRDAVAPAKVVVGIGSAKHVSVAKSLYGWVGSRLHFAGYEEAEFVKYTNNLFHALLISFWNELDLVAEQFAKVNGQALDMDRIARLTALEPGLESVYRVFGKAWGGACLPKDTRAFRTFANHLGAGTPTVDALISVNEKMRCLRGEQTRHWRDLHRED
jgi:nucleotide sugar dehydrogenase